MISYRKLDQFTDSEIDRICFERGIEIQEKTKQQKLKDLKLWLAISNLNNVPDTLLLFSRIVDFAEDLFKLDEDEDEFEVLRRVSLIKLTYIG